MYKHSYVALTGVMPLFFIENALRPVAVARASASANAPRSFKPRSCIKGEVKGGKEIGVLAVLE